MTSPPNRDDDVTVHKNAMRAAAPDDETLKSTSSPTMAASIRVQSQDLPWRDTPYAGVQWKKLFFDGRASAVLLKFAPGAAYGVHRHPDGEQYYVVEGTIDDGGETWGAGSYVRHPPGSVHRPSSKGGCLLFVTLGAPIEVLGSG